MTEQIIKDWKVPSREERETILIYEEEVDQWHIYSDVPKHARKYEKYVDESKNYRKGYNITGGNVGIRKKMSDKKRKAISERMKKLREENKL